MEGKYEEIQQAQFPQKQFYSSEKDIEDREASLDAYVKVVATLCPTPVEVQSFLGLTAQDFTAKAAASEALGAGSERLGAAWIVTPEPSLVRCLFA